MVCLSPVWLMSYKKEGNLYTDTWGECQVKTQGHAEGRDPCGGGGEPGAMLPSPRSQLGLPGAGAGKEGSSPTAFRSLAGTFIRTCSLQELWENRFLLLRPTSLWHLVRAALVTNTQGHQLGSALRGPNQGSRSSDREAWESVWSLMFWKQSWWEFADTLYFGGKCNAGINWPGTHLRSTLEGIPKPARSF